jgi:hypothetical protein
MRIAGSVALVTGANRGPQLAAAAAPRLDRVRPGRADGLLALSAGQDAAQLPSRTRDRPLQNSPTG